MWKPAAVKTTGHFSPAWASISLWMHCSQISFIDLKLDNMKKGWCSTTALGH